jgi:hypothetical protein
MEFICRPLDVWRFGRDQAAGCRGVAPGCFKSSGTRDLHMTDFVDIALPAAAQTAAETLGLTVQRTVTSGARVRQIPRDEAELVIEYLREWGFAARIVEHTPGDEPRRAA